MADMSYESKLADLGSLSAQDLTALRTEIISAFEEADNNDDLTAMSSAADALDQVKAAMSAAEGTSTQSITDTPDVTNNMPTPETQQGNMPVAASAGEGEPTPAGTGTAGPDEKNDTVADAAAVVAPPEPAAEPEEESETGEADPEEAEEASESGEAEAEGETAESDASADGDGAVTAGTLPAALKGHEFKKGEGGKNAAKKKASPPAADADDEDDPEEEDEDDAVTAAASETPEETAVEQSDIPTERQPIVASSTSTVVAGADIPQKTAGSEFGSYREVNEAFVNRLETVQRSRGGDGDHIIVASVKSEVEDSRQLVAGQDTQNFEKIDFILNGMKQLSPIMASGGYCAPLETRYDIFGVGVTDRPVRDSLAGFQSTRGGIRYVAPPTLASFGTGAVGLWTAANDANPTNPATKPFLVATCQSETTVTVDAITLEIQFGNLMTRAYPELVARNNELGLIAQARFAEQNLLTKISALSTAVSSTFVLGTARDVLNSLGRIASAYRARHRMNAAEVVRVIAPIWALDAMREDLTRGYPGNDIQWADDQITSALAARKVNVTWHLDDSSNTGALVAGVVPDFPATIRYWVFAEGTFLFLDGGTLDLGIVRDSTLVGTNDYRMFVETFESVAKVGVESVQVTVTTHISGAIVGTITPV